MDQTVIAPDSILIAIADDHPIFRRGVSEVINSFKNCKVVISAANGLDLLQNLSESQPLPDLCILDINMPVMNGYDTITALRKKWPDIKVLILSVINDEYAILRMLKIGAKGFLLKDCHPNNLQDAIYTISNGQLYYSDLVTEKEIQNISHTVIPAISERQLEFLIHCASDMNYIEIAQHMGISVRAVESMQQRLSEKLKISSRVGLALFAVRTGLIM